MDLGNRDLDDLDDDNLAVYNVRGYTVFQLNKTHNRIYIGRNATYVLPCTEDCTLLAEFLLKCRDYIEGKIDHVENVVVN